MALVVEDGSVVEGANSYASYDALLLYAEERGHSSVESADEDAAEAALVRGTSYVDGRYASRWPGSKVGGREQTLAWPRRLVVDSYGDDVPDDEIPREIVWAACEAAIRELDSPGSLTPDYVATQQIVSESVGPISVQYSDPGDSSGVRPVVTRIDEILWPLLLASGTGTVRYLQRA